MMSTSNFDQWTLYIKLYTWTLSEWFQFLFKYTVLSGRLASLLINILGLFKCIVSDLFFYNNQKSATSVFVIPTSVLVISCKSVSSIQKPQKKSITYDQKE